MISKQSYINLFQFTEACLLVSCRILFYMERNSELFLFRGIVRNGIPTACFYFCSTERNSELFSLPRKGLEPNSESRLLFCSTEQNSELFSLPRKERNSERFLFRRIAGIPSEMIICSVYFVFRGIIFSSEIPNPNHICPW
jgi:hypothetical protein